MRSHFKTRKCKCTGGASFRESNKQRKESDARFDNVMTESKAEYDRYKEKFDEKFECQQADFDKAVETGGFIGNRINCLLDMSEYLGRFNSEMESAYSHFIAEMLESRVEFYRKFADSHDKLAEWCANFEKKIIELRDELYEEMEWSYEIYDVRTDWINEMINKTLNK